MKLPFIEIIESVTPNLNLLMWKYDDKDTEIKNGAKLTVRESQLVLFMNEGQIADVFEAGLHILKTENIPVLSRLKGWKQGFKSPFKADVYFFNKHQFINNKWGTPAPILMRDLDFGQVRIRAFGSFDFRIGDVARFFKEYCGTYKQLTMFELQRQLRDFVAPIFGEVLAQNNIPVKDVAGNITDLSNQIEPYLKPYFEQLGIELTQFVITSITLPNQVTEHFDKITQMNMVDDIDKYSQFNKINAMSQEGTAINEGMLMGVMMNQVQSKQQNQQSITDDITTKLQKLKTLFENDLIDEQEYKSKKIELINLL